MDRQTIEFCGFYASYSVVFSLFLSLSMCSISISDRRRQTNAPRISHVSICNGKVFGFLCCDSCFSVIRKRFQMGQTTTKNIIEAQIKPSKVMQEEKKSGEHVKLLFIDEFWLKFFASFNRRQPHKATTTTTTFDHWLSPKINKPNSLRQR